MPVSTRLKGFVSRIFPPATPDGNLANLRLGRYGEVYVISQVRKMHAVVDEGYHMTAHNLRNAIGNANATAYSETNPHIVIVNQASPSDPNARRIYLDYIYLQMQGTYTAGTNVQCAVVVDRQQRYVSGGTPLLGQNALIQLPAGTNPEAPEDTVAMIWYGNITATASVSSTTRQIVPNRIIKTTIAAINDQYYFSFGGVEAYGTAPGSFVVMPFPGFVIGPGCQLLFYLWQPSATAWGTSIPEIAYWER